MVVGGLAQRMENALQAEESSKLKNLVLSYHAVKSVVSVSWDLYIGHFKTWYWLLLPI